MSDCQKYVWFNRLPVARINSNTYERTCHCGQTIWYENDSFFVRSWIEIHYAHGIEPVKLIKGYDFTKKIKFSAAGFEVFAKLFELKISTAGETEHLAEFHDSAGNLFSFSEDHQLKPPLSDHEGTFRTFLPEKSFLR